MADVVVDFLMKQKSSNGTYTILHPITKTANVKTSENISVMLKSNLGSLTNGYTIPAGTSIDTIIKQMVQVQIPPTYSAPTLTLKATGATAGSYEEGTEVTPTLTSTFVKNDAGALTAIVIKKNNVEVASSTTSPATHTETITVSGTITYSSTATYGEGAIKNDNFNQPYSTGHIEAGSKSSSEIKYTSYRKYFYGADNVTTAATTSDNVRGFVNSSSSGASAGTTFNVSVTKGQTRATFAYPATLRDVSSVKYVEFNNDESKTFFNKTTVQVKGANDYTAIDYKVYTYIPDQPFPSNMTFAVTI